MLKKCIGDPSLILPTENIRITDSLSYKEIPIQILDRQVRRLRTKDVASVKVLWRNQFVEEATWEAEEDMKQKYPYLFESGGNADQDTDFADVAIFQGSQISSCSTNFTRPASFSFHPPFLNFSAPRNMSNLKRGWMYERLDGLRGEEDAIDEMYYVNDLHGGTQPELGYDNPYRQMVLDVAGPNFDQDGYVSNLGRCPDTNTKKLYGMKSHDCHVFMQRLLPIAFRELLPSNVWQALTELSLFFKDLTSTTLRVDDMERLEADIPQILCKLEHIFPPGFFDSMEHLPVHLPYEAKIAGPVQYRWMYPFERYLGTLKRMIGNKASVEGSICEAYLMTESTLLFSHYFEPHVMTRNHNVDRNDDGGITEDLEGNLSIFTYPGRLWGETRKRNLSLDEVKAAQTYILLNCEEVEPFVSMYVQRLQEESPNLSQCQIDESLEAYFSIWFKEYVRCNHIENKFLRSLAHGPLIGATCHSMYFVNGYKFHTECYGSARSTMNSGVCISDPNFGDYYGRIKEIIQVEYREEPLKQTFLFKCEWFDPTIDVGVKKHNQYKLIDVNQRRRYKKYEPFILAMQATQVCYVPYPSKKKDKIDWLAVLKVKPRNVVELPDEKVAPTPELNVPFQVNEVEVHEIDINVSVDEEILLHDLNGGVLEMEEPIDGLHPNTQQQPCKRNNNNDMLIIKKKGH
ncbi:hypothetical protein MTR67_022177 [Solanum verrucosum]|uniref:DUF4218 domain-containing protein n=1 Tax=Solanum verrucosum TaxID=315347 RepID=A0AAF0TQB2_SOLVR|nr:hypothetical protein MTR67_022177 [Solanum verrucosum]